MVRFFVFVENKINDVVLVICKTVKNTYKVVTRGKNWRFCHESGAKLLNCGVQWQIMLQEKGVFSDFLEIIAGVCILFLR